jgi:hypothetical protein
MSDKLIGKYLTSNPYDWTDMIRPADRVNLAKDIKKLAIYANALRQELEATRGDYNNLCKSLSHVYDIGCSTKPANSCVRCGNDINHPVHEGFTPPPRA